MALQDENGHEPAVGSAKYFALLEARLQALEIALRQYATSQAEVPLQVEEDATDTALPAQNPARRSQRG